MLVTFKTNAYSDITLFGEPAVALLKLMGQSGNVPGALLAADIPEALRTLQDSLAKTKDDESLKPAENASERSEPASSDSEEVAVALHKRAGPLLSLLRSAADSNENVLWE